MPSYWPFHFYQREREAEEIVAPFGLCKRIAPINRRHEFPDRKLPGSLTAPCVSTHRRSDVFSLQQERRAFFFSSVISCVFTPICVAGFPLTNEYEMNACYRRLRQRSCFLLLAFCGSVILSTHLLSFWVLLFVSSNSVFFYEICNKHKCEAELIIYRVSLRFIYNYLNMVKFVEMSI